MHDDFGGLDRDFREPDRRLINRRQALTWCGGVGLIGLAACTNSSSQSGGEEASDRADDAAEAAPGTGDAGSDATSGSDSSPAGDPGGGDGVASSPGPEIPDETAGPFPADGTNGPNLIDLSEANRRDLTTSIGSLTGTAVGVPTTIELTVVDASSGAPLPGAVVYLWHCTADGAYSIYEIEDQNYLRGLQAADDAGRLTFATIFPGCYQGRWPHCHFEVFESRDQTETGGQAIKTSQLAIPQADCEAVYVDDRYGQSSSNLAELSLETDGVFQDGWQDQLATVIGSVDEGYTVSLLVRV